MKLIDRIRKKAQTLDKTVVLPEGSDERIKKAAGIIEKSNIAGTVVLDGKENSLKEGCRLLKDGKADGMVAGAANSTADVIRTALKGVGVREGVSVVSSFFIMTGEDENIGQDGSLVFADCAVIPNPDSGKLADIAINTAAGIKDILNWEPKVAMLSFSTKGSARHSLADKVRKAVDILKEKNPDFIYDGELQLDTALVPEVAQKKDPSGKLSGRANILIFPDLNSGNIGYKLVQRLGGFTATGPVLQGFKKPVNDLSRGCSVEDIVNAAAVTVLQAER
ncbi:MAG: phosphotransacetylase [Elusimicrobiota bacterium]|nr:phosphotransacetylase [Elusimicrobiota bacterium]